MKNNYSYRYLCIRLIGGGKALLFTTIARSKCGITICISTLLPISSDQASKCYSKVKTATMISSTLFYLDVVVHREINYCML